MVICFGMLAIFEQTDQHRLTQCYDGQNYFFPMARSLWQQGLPIDTWGHFCTHQGPGFPLLLAPFLAAGDYLSVNPVIVARVLNVLCAGLAILGAYSLAARMMGWRFALLAALSFGFYPPFLWLTRNAYNEPFYTALLIWGIYSVLTGIESGKKFMLFGGGALLGLATLTRAVGLLAPVVILAALATVQSRTPGYWKSCVVVVVSYLLVMSPWTYIASSHAGRLVIATTSFPGSHIDGLVTLKQNPIGMNAELFFKNHSRSIGSIIDFHQSQLADTGSYLRLFLRKVYDSWTATEAGSGRVALAILNLPLLAVAGLATAFLYRKKRLTSEQGAELAAFLLLVGYFWGMNLLVWSTMRYMVPVSFVLSLLVFKALELKARGR